VKKNLEFNNEEWMLENRKKTRKQKVLIAKTCWESIMTAVKLIKATEDN